jgi:zinc transport system substrate-binding protein
MAQAVDEVAGAMSEAVPASSDVFEQSAAMYLEELDELDREFDRGLSSCARDEIVTSHAAFFYLAARYGLEQLPITGVSPEAEPDAERMAELADLIDERDITTVFSEELLSPELAETLARETGARTDVLNPIEGLDDEQIDAGATYASEMRENLAALREALGCE